MTSPECSGVAVPAIAEMCADGSSGSPYYVWNGSQCVLTFSCPTSPGRPVPVPPGTTYPGPVPGPAPYPGPPPPPSPAPPVCNFALPNLCEACPNGETICAHYAIQNGTCVVEICPPSYVPPPTPTPLPPSPPGGSCSQGAYCSPGTACGGGPDSNGCFVSCTCDTYGTLQCGYMCGFGAYDAGED